jgi:UDPglucose 6-dehydrogenase
MDERSAEMTKYAANAFLATKISFMNEVANLCEATDANVDSVRLGMGSDERIGKRFLFPGIGYGGSCFPKDVQALIHTADQHEYDFKILRSVTGVNDQQKHVILNKVNRFYGGNLKGRKFAIWGLAFKPDTDDIREAASLVIINDLLEKEAEVTGTDPAAIENTRRQIVHKGFTVEEDSYRALRGADALIIATEWPLYRNPDFDRMKRLLKEPVIFDGRNLYEPDDMEQEGFYYSSIGRALVDGRKAH